MVSNILIDNVLSGSILISAVFYVDVKLKSVYIYNTPNVTFHFFPEPLKVTRLELSGFFKGAEG